MEVKIKADDVKKRYREYEISGDISVQNIEDLSQKMKNCTQDCDELNISLTKITGFDTAAFQFFYALKNSFIRDRKKLTVSCNLSSETAQLLKNCGISDLSSVLSYGGN
jgi:ABC-type transporter Mla MlaB component